MPYLRAQDLFYVLVVSAVLGGGLAVLSALVLPPLGFGFTWFISAAAIFAYLTKPVWDGSLNGGT